MPSLALFGRVQGPILVVRFWLGQLAATSTNIIDEELQNTIVFQKTVDQKPSFFKKLAFKNYCFSFLWGTDKARIEVSYKSFLDPTM